MRKFHGKMVVYDLCETYHNCGTYEFKIVLDKTFKNGHNISIEMFDPQNNLMDLQAEVWGRKINCKFVIKDSISDGVCMIKINLKDELKESLQCWIIK